MKLMGKSIYNFLSNGIDEALRASSTEMASVEASAKYNAAYDKIYQALPDGKKNLMNEFDEAIGELEGSKEYPIYAKGLQDGFILYKLLFPDRSIDFNEYGRLTARLLSSKDVQEAVKEIMEGMARAQNEL